jgi:hypothetical protein
MEEVLRANDHKDGWERMKFPELLWRLRQELDELEAAVKEKRDGDVPLEAVDVANFCMFIYNNVTTWMYERIERRGKRGAEEKEKRKAVPGDNRGRSNRGIRERYGG